jgi:hypothetical protein
MPGTHAGTDPHPSVGGALERRWKGWWAGAPPRQVDDERGGLAAALQLLALVVVGLDEADRLALVLGEGIALVLSVMLRDAVRDALRPGAHLNHHQTPNRAPARPIHVPQFPSFHGLGPAGRSQTWCSCERRRDSATSLVCSCLGYRTAERMPRPVKNSSSSLSSSCSGSATAPRCGLISSP